MRYMIVGLTLIAGSCATHASPEVEPARTHPAERLLRTPEGQVRNPFCFIDRRTASCADLERYPADSIQAIEIFKHQAAVQRYGFEAAEGAILLTTKTASAARLPADNTRNVFFFIDGRTASFADSRALSPDHIHGIAVLPGPIAVARFGSEAVDGAVLITTKGVPGR